MDYSALGKRIRAERQKNKLTQAELAEKINVTTAFIGQIERGERKFSLETLIEITSALNVSADYILRDSMIYNNNSAMSELMSLLENQDISKMHLAIDIIKSVFEHIDKQSK